MFDSNIFNYITFNQIDQVREYHPLVYNLYLADAKKTTLFQRLKDCPDISEDFPCFFYISARDKVIATFGAMPDKLYANGKIHRWAWAGGLLTDPHYRGRGIATQLVENMVNVLHQKGIAWGGVFSTPIAIGIYRKLGFTIPGYANRYVIFKTLKPFLNSKIKNRLLSESCDKLYRALVYLMLPLINKPNKCL